MPEAGAGTATQVRNRAGSVRGWLFVAVLVVTLLTGFSIGRLASTGFPTATGPGGHVHGPGAEDPTADGRARGADGHAKSADGHAHPAGPTGGDVGGLAVSAGGYTLAAETTTFAPGVAAPFRFRIRGPDRTPVTSFAVVHDKQLHLILVRRDLTGYQHVHPTMAADGTWSIPLTLPTPGVWRAIADFTPGDKGTAHTSTTLGVDLTVPGAYTATPLPAAERTAGVDGFTVTYEGAPQVGAAKPLQLRVARDGAPVTNLERYLGAYGHLVVMRDGDLGYLHVHPEDAIIGGAVKFWVTAPSPGRYRGYFDFQVAGQVRTAEFTIEVT